MGARLRDARQRCAETHAIVAGTRGRKMLDYFGRNVAIRHSWGEFCLVINQDIFISGASSRLIAKRRLSKKHFIAPTDVTSTSNPAANCRSESLEACAATATFVIHRRHQIDQRTDLGSAPRLR